MDIKDGIWPPYQAFYVEAMLFNTRSAMASIERVSVTIDALTKDPSGELFDRIDRRGLLNELQNIVQQAAALSRYFWPMTKGNERYESRAQQLRAAYSVKAESPLKDRGLRNQIEHFDEKLDDYLKDGIVGYILPEYVGPLLERDGVPGHLFRAYYLDEGIFEVLGKQYKVQPIAPAPPWRPTPRSASQASAGSSLPTCPVGPHDRLGPVP